MSALNRTETEQLREAFTVIGLVLVDGYDPSPENKDPMNAQRGRRMKEAKDQIKTIWTMKGHYPS